MMHTTPNTTAPGLTAHADLDVAGAAAGSRGIGCGDLASARTDVRFAAIFRPVRRAGFFAFLVRIDILLSKSGGSLE